jgi:P4 family phage/plasmid primase-like protien
LRAQKITQWSPEASAEAEPIVADIARRFGPPGWFNKSGNCTRLNERFWAELYRAEQEIIHERDEERFYQYDPQTGLWQVRTANAIKAEISDRIRSLSLKYAPGLLVQDTEHNRRNIVSLLRGVTEERDFFVERPLAIHAGNCMVVIEDGQTKVEEFDSRFRSRNQLSVDYDPEVIARRFWDELLKPVNPADREVIKKMMGLIVCGVNRAQRIFILIGEGNTGKTTLALVMQNLIGIANCVELRPHLLGERFELSRTLGKTLYLGPDVPGNFLQNVGAARLKSLVGHDPMDAERKNSNEHFPFRGSLNVLITANTRLLVRLHGDHSAWLRRLVMIDFKGKPKKRIENFAELLVQTEGSGILNLAIEGLVNFEVDLKQYGDLSLAREQVARVELLLTESEGLRIFLESELEQDSEADLSVDEILSSYATFAREKGWQVVSVRNLQAQLKDLMLEVWSAPQAHSLKRNDKSVRGYYGIRLK